MLLFTYKTGIIAENQYVFAKKADATNVKILFLFLFKTNFLYIGVQTAEDIVERNVRAKRTKIGDFSAQGWNLPKVHMPTS